VVAMAMLSLFQNSIILILWFRIRRREQRGASVRV